VKQIQATDDANVNSINAALEGNLRPVTRWSTPVVAVCATGGTAVVAAHDLGVVPNSISVVPWIDARWWADEGDRKMWTERAIVFHASAKGRYTVKAGSL